MKKFFVVLICLAIIYFAYGGNSTKTILNETNMSLEKITEERDLLKKNVENSEDLLNKKIAELRDANYDIERLNDEVKNLKEQISNLSIMPKKLTLNESGLKVLEIFESKKFEGLSDIVSDEGVLFSMDGVLSDYDVRFKPGDFRAKGFYGELFRWKDDSRDVSSNFPDFVKNYVYDYDFLNANFIGVNSFVSDKESDFSFDYFTDCEFLEFNVKNEDVDESLVLVFVKESENYKLRAVLRG